MHVAPFVCASPCRQYNLDYARDRVFAENVLGAGTPSPPVQVDVQAFLGHLRAQDDGGVRKAQPLPSPRLRQEQQNKLTPSQTTPAAAAAAAYNTRAESTPNKTPLAAASSSLSSLSSGCTPTSSSSSPHIPQQQQQQQLFSSSKPLLRTAMEGVHYHSRTGPSKRGEAGTATAAVAAGAVVGAVGGEDPSIPPDDTFGADFMGLRGFGEARVNGLFDPPTSMSSRRMQQQQQQQRAPAADVAGEKVRFDGPYDYHRCSSGDGAHTITRRLHSSSSSSSLLPPIVVASGISGEGGARRGGGGGDGVGPVGARGVDGAGGGYYCGGSDGSSNNNNDVFHAFLNLGRRLPGRLVRRDRDRLD